jgi:hypothetical protein
MYPGSFIWRWINDKWLMSKAASVFFAGSAFLIVGMTVVVLKDIDTGHLTLASNLLLGAGGVLSAIGAFFLWGGMWRHCRLHNFSSPASRRLWSAILVVGVFYGAVLYYGCVYLTATAQRGVRPSGGRAG